MTLQLWQWNKLSHRHTGKSNVCATFATVNPCSPPVEKHALENVTSKCRSVQIVGILCHHFGNTVLFWTSLQKNLWRMLKACWGPFIVEAHEQQGLLEKYYLEQHHLWQWHSLIWLWASSAEDRGTHDLCVKVQRSWQLSQCFLTKLKESTALLLKTYSCIICSLTVNVCAL